MGRTEDPSISDIPNDRRISVDASVNFSRSSRTSRHARTDENLDFSRNTVKCTINKTDAAADDSCSTAKSAFFQSGLYLYVRAWRLNNLCSCRKPLEKKRTQLNFSTPKPTGIHVNYRLVRVPARIIGNASTLGTAAPHELAYFMPALVVRSGFRRQVSSGFTVCVCVSPDPDRVFFLRFGVSGRESGRSAAAAVVLSAPTTAGTPALAGFYCY